MWAVAFLTTAAFGWQAADAQKLGPVASAVPGSSTAKVRIDFQAKPWAEVVKWLAAQLDLTLQMDFTPPGKLTCSEPKEFTKDQLFDFLHGLLLDRGITMIRKDRLLIVLLLAENQHGDYLRHVDVDHLDELPKSEIVATTFKLTSLQADEAAKEFLPSLSARAKLVGIPSMNRLIATDRVDTLIGLREILRELDPPDQVRSAGVKFFVLKHSSARYVALTLKDLTGGTLKDDVNPLAALTDFKKLGRQFGNRQMLESFVPGMSFKGVVADAPRDPKATHLSYSEPKNAVIVAGEPEVLALASQVVSAMDRPESKIDGDEFVFHSYRVDSGKGKQLAVRLTGLFSEFSGFRVDATDTALIVRATRKQHTQISEILERTQAAANTIAVFSVGEREADLVKKQLDRIFASDGSRNAPTIIADKPGRNVVVRGTTEQIGQIRAVMIGLGVPVQ